MTTAWMTCVARSAAVVFLLLGTGFVHAGPLLLLSNTTTSGGLDAVAFSVDPNDLAGGYDTIDFDFDAKTSGTFNQDGTALSVGVSEFTSFNGLTIILNGLNGFGIAVDSNELKGTIASLGSNAISTSVFDFGQIVATSGNIVDFFYRLRFVDDAIQVAEITNIPEPTCSTVLFGLLFCTWGKCRHIRHLSVRKSV